LRILLLAGEGILPVLVKEEASRAFQVITVSCRLLRSHPRLFPEYLLEHFSLRKLAEILTKEQPYAVCCAGKVPKAHVFAFGATDASGAEFFSACQSLRDRDILGKFLEFFQKQHVQVLSPVNFLRKWITREGVFCGPLPTEEEWHDIRYGLRIARFLADEEIGQTVVVKRGTIVALEGAEGTDETIRRGLALARGGVVVKVARSNQDFFIDIPTVGAETVRLLVEGGGRVLALESGRTLLVDQEEVQELSKRSGVTVLGITL
jgi:DUF1009 family protein